MAHAYTIDLANEDRDYLQSLTRQRTIQAQVVDRAKTLLYKAEGMSNGAIADRLDVNINTIKLCLNKYKEGGIQRALFDDQRSGRRVERMSSESSVTIIRHTSLKKPRTALPHVRKVVLCLCLHQRTVPG